MTDEFDPVDDAAACYDAAINTKRVRYLQERCSAARRIEVIGDCTLYLGNSMEVLPQIGKFDAIVTDPPYGIGADKAASKNKGKWGWTDYGHTDWDSNRPPRDLFDMIRSVSKDQIIWGGNYFTDFLPPTMQWLLWDKGQREFSLADFEMAWSSQNKAARIFTYPRARALQDGKQHPTQKPLELMEWCLTFVPKAKTICDPFLGSGTTGVACSKARRTFVGIEMHEPYFDIACKRIEDAYKQPDMFVEPAPAATQVALDL